MTIPHTTPVQDGKRGYGRRVVTVRVAGAGSTSGGTGTGAARQAAARPDIGALVHRVARGAFASRSDTVKLPVHVDNPRRGRHTLPPTMTPLRGRPTPDRLINPETQRIERVPV